MGRPMGCRRIPSIHDQPGRPVRMKAKTAMSQPLSAAATATALGVTRASDVQRDIEERLTRTVMQSFDGCQNERLTLLMKALVRHLHAFIRDVRLTEAEWNTAIEFLTE